MPCQVNNRGRWDEKLAKWYAATTTQLFKSHPSIHHLRQCSSEWVGCQSTSMWTSNMVSGTPEEAVPWWEWSAQPPGCLLRPHAVELDSAGLCPDRELSLAALGTHNKPSLSGAVDIYDSICTYSPGSWYLSTRDWGNAEDSQMFIHHLGAAAE